MKKILMFVVSLFIFVPFVVNADSSIKESCSGPDANGIKTCVINAKFDQLMSNVTVAIKEEGGAEVIQESLKSKSSNYSLISSENNNLWTVELNGPGEEGEFELFEFQYKVSDTKDCKITLSFSGKNIVIEDTTDKKENDKQTGFTLPYIALGSIAIIAGAVYLNTKNKSKMYKI